MFLPLASLIVCAALGTDAGNACGRSYLFPPSYCVDEDPSGAVEPYVPQAGDIFLATDRCKIIQAGHFLATSGAPHHSGIVITRADGSMGLLESGPFNCLHVVIGDLQENLEKHETRGEKIWIRRRRTPLSPAQNAEMTAWAMRQEGKWFAAGRMLMQLTPFRERGPLRTYVMGYPRGEHASYFCSELVLETCVHVGLLAPETTRPTSTYPRDLFFDHSPNRFLNEHFSLAPDWYPPARWTQCHVPPE